MMRGDTQASSASADEDFDLFVPTAMFLRSCICFEFAGCAIVLRLIRLVRAPSDR